MFFQYLFFAVWWVPLAAYLTNMDVGSTQKAMIFHLPTWSLTSAIAMSRTPSEIFARIS